jgi:hypothetical protein
MSVMQPERATRVLIRRLHRVHGEQWQRCSFGADSETAGLCDNPENVGVQPQRTQFGKTHPNQSLSELVLHWLQRVLVHSSICANWKWPIRGIVTKHYHRSKWNSNGSTPRPKYQVAIGNYLVFHSRNLNQFQWLLKSWCIYLLNSSQLILIINHKLLPIYYFKH